METNLSERPDLTGDVVWGELYQTLRPFTQRLQKNDGAEDILQETLCRMVEYTRKAKSGEVKPIHSLKGLAVTTARNYQYDLWRRNRRVVGFTASNYSVAVYAFGEDTLDVMEVAVENVYREQLFKLLAQEIACFPPKQKQALLIDLANRMSFGSRPSPLQEAFLEVGIDLQEYQRPLPDDPVEYSRHAALLNCAYKRIVKLSCVQEYVKSA
jgi:DNA-directed RNA polymerase specialized sigma24 family protein